MHSWHRRRPKALEGAVSFACRARAFVELLNHSDAVEELHHGPTLVAQPKL